MSCVAAQSSGSPSVSTIISFRFCFCANKLFAANHIACAIGVQPRGFWSK
ncbi:Uncharacterised protein [Vibrio cholerae]|nr:Uncharacterised protein [Vibrio cholerae]